ncbi:MAG TPA: hypothetical protein VFH07_12135 [Chitinophagaceae bacterium]|nr:hypothetical protein [Chitinophagaceae bacterium]
MQSENFDKKIKDSLSQPPPGNENPAWDKMEELLDKHMPVEKKDKRRFVFILFLFLLTGGGAFLIWQNNNEDKNNISAIESQNKKSEEPGTVVPSNENANNNTAGNEKEITPQKTPGNITDQTNSKERKTLPTTSSTNPFSNPEPTPTNVSATKIPRDKKNYNTIAENNDPTEKISTTAEKNTKPVATEDVVKTEPSSVSKEKTEQIKDESQKPVIEKTSEQKPETTASQPIATEKSNAQKQKNKKSPLNNLFFTASAGPDFSAVGFDNAGKVQMAYGAGLGYKISDKFSIRTGFYAARKVYSADPDDYDPPYNVSQYYPNLKNIDANCKVYEIPVTVDFTISKNTKQSWFVSTGLSSLIMKEETYDFYFKPNYSPNYIVYSKTITNENKHYFSVLNLSGGYTRNLNRNISLQAEPYLKIALDGVGLGNINLNSGGILFSAIIKPFASKN